MKHFVCLICKAIIEGPLKRLTRRQTRDMGEHSAGVFTETALTQATLTRKRASGWIRVDLGETVFQLKRGLAQIFVNAEIDLFWKR